jgi:hypothetical protein
MHTKVGLGKHKGGAARGKVQSFNFFPGASDLTLTY